ncbi:MAG: tetratricopeptide repeat protein, partial [Spirochaetia bacterium]
YEALMEALEIYPNNHIIHYYTGLASSQLANTKPEEQERREILERSAHYYERAVELKGNYVDALYALSVLYIFELDRPYDAEEYVEKILSIRSNHYRAMFLLARIRVEQGRTEEAVEIYDEIGETAEDQEMVDRARENRERLMRGENGN